ncbi:class GN sortase [Shewanella sp. AS1]|uniref:class GN sortase n=1 Tax=Shewanella sp. AS1 TaxID=2907626 RepID=UPI001F39169D|nr:class GN sortase [Shewanella sp. AS1]MCE9678870.1 class GN sortase [Shewanella sp. AS1]
MKLRRYFLLGCLLLALAMIAKGGYMQAKAHFAQFLIEQAWRKTLDDGEWHKPWSWADTHPIARLSFLDQAGGAADPLFILAGASGRNLAFGPSAILTDNRLNQAGNTIIAAHRDTHFARLSMIQNGQLIALQDSRAVERIYRVTQIEVVDEQDTSLMDSDELQLTLVTCYPFESLTGQSRWRYVVIARPITLSPAHEFSVR